MASNVAEKLLSAPHPYYPIDLKLPGYVAPLLPFTTVLAIFFSASAVLVLVSWLISGAVT